MVSQVLRTAGQGDAEALAGSAGVGGVAGAGAMENGEIVLRPPPPH